MDLGFKGGAISVRKITLAAMFLALGLVLPFLTGQLPRAGNMLLPMHLPVFLCGLILGWRFGLGVGFLLPLLRSVIFGMPQIYPMAVSMAFELAAYGFTAGFLYMRSAGRGFPAVLRSLLIAMIAGRVVWGIAQVLLLGLGESGFSFKLFVTGAVVNALPGIALQIALIPAIMTALTKAALIPIKDGAA